MPEHDSGVLQGHRQAKIGKNEALEAESATGQVSYYVIVVI